MHVARGDPISRGVVRSSNRERLAKEKLADVARRSSGNRIAARPANDLATRPASRRASRPTCSRHRAPRAASGRTAATLLGRSAIGPTTLNKLLGELTKTNLRLVGFRELTGDRIESFVARAQKIEEEPGPIEEMFNVDQLDAQPRFTQQPIASLPSFVSSRLDASLQQVIGVGHRPDDVAVQLLGSCRFASILVVAQDLTQFESAGGPANDSVSALAR